MAIKDKNGKMAPYRKDFGNTKRAVTKNGGMTTTGMGKLASASTRAKKVSGSKD